MQYMLTISWLPWSVTEVSLEQEAEIVITQWTNEWSCNLCHKDKMMINVALAEVIPVNSYIRKYYIYYWCNLVLWFIKRRFRIVPSMANRLGLEWLRLLSLRWEAQIPLLSKYNDKIWEVCWKHLNHLFVLIKLLLRSSVRPLVNISVPSLRFYLGMHIKSLGFFFWWVHFEMIRIQEVTYEFIKLLTCQHIHVWTF